MKKVFLTVAFSAICSVVTSHAATQSSLSYANAPNGVTVDINIKMLTAADITDPTTQFYNPLNAHIYAFVNTPTHWTVASPAALASKLGNQAGYLATITSESEQAFIQSHLSSTPALSYWLGGHRESDLSWDWVDGPEAGSKFWQNNADGYALNGAYTNWDLTASPPQPNQVGEDYLNIDAVSYGYNLHPGAWADAGDWDNWGSVIEYGGGAVVPNTTGNGLMTVYNVQNIMGSNYNDMLIGNDQANILNGGPGDDVIAGGGGTDQLTGGPGKDVFIFKSPSDSPVGAGRDVIADFTSGQDKIDVSAIDANPTRPGDQAFKFIESRPFSGKPGELRFSGGILSGDVNGDKVPDFEIGVVGTVRKFDLVL